MHRPEQAGAFVGGLGPTRREGLGIGPRATWERSDDVRATESSGGGPEAVRPGSESSLRAPGRPDPDGRLPGGEHLAGPRPDQSGRTVDQPRAAPGGQSVHQRLRRVRQLGQAGPGRGHPAIGPRRDHPRGRGPGGEGRGRPVQRRQLDRRGRDVQPATGHPAQRRPRRGARRPGPDPGGDHVQHRRAGHGEPGRGPPADGAQPGPDRHQRRGDRHLPGPQRPERRRGRDDLIAPEPCRDAHALPGPGRLFPAFG